MIKEKVGDPEASVSVHNLERIDASRGWLGVVLRIPAFGRTPHLDKIAKRAARNAECRSQRGVSWFAIQMRAYFMGEKSSGRM
jgi:hypothetical protein